MDILPMTLEDLPEVLHIEKASFPLPFSEHLFRMELHLSMAHLYVAKERSGRDPVVVGYMDFWDVGPELHLINIATHPEWRRRGIGSSLMKFLMEYAERHRSTEVTLDVRASNASAISLYEKFGFRRVGLRKKYYQDNEEDAVLMSLTR